MLSDDLQFFQSVVEVDLVDDGLHEDVHLRTLRVVGRAYVAHAVVVDQRGHLLAGPLPVGVVDRDRMAPGVLDQPHTGDVGGPVAHVDHVFERYGTLVFGDVAVDQLRIENRLNALVVKSLEEKRKMDIENGKKGGRPKKVAKSAETPVSKGRKPTENQKRREEESKEEESKGSVSVVNNNRSNIETPSLVSRLADEGNHGPLQPVLPWEKLVDQLSTFQSYMELAGQHSGLGKLFVDHQKLILEIFKKHIRLYDKGAGLLFPEDVKRYFSNYIAAGSVTCRTLRETLLKELENTVDKDVNRFESVVDGRRTYLGHLIPVDAPPRPDASAVWDDVKKRWAH